MSDSEPKKDDKKIYPEAWIAATLMACLVLLTSVQVFVRFTFGIAISWLEEVIRIIFIWCICASFVVAAADDKHIRLILQIYLFPEKIRKLILFIADLAWIVFNGIIIYGAIVYAITLFNRPYIMPTTGVNLLWLFLIIPISFFLISIRIVINMRRRTRVGVDGVESRTSGV